MGDLIFVVVVVAFFVGTVAYVRGCERILGEDTGEVPMDAEAQNGASALEAMSGRAR